MQLKTLPITATTQQMNWQTNKNQRLTSAIAMKSTNNPQMKKPNKILNINQNKPKSSMTVTSTSAGTLTWMNNKTSKLTMKTTARKLKKKGNRSKTETVKRTATKSIRTTTFCSSNNMTTLMMTHWGTRALISGSVGIWRTNWEQWRLWLRTQVCLTRFWVPESQLWRIARF